MDFNIFNILNDLSDNNSIDVSVADGTYETGVIAERFREGVFVIVFFDADGNIVTPTAGTITTNMSPYKAAEKQQYQWLAPSCGDAVISATDVVSSTDGVARYTLPLFIGPTVKGRMTLSGITGADHCQAFFWRTV